MCRFGHRRPLQGIMFMQGGIIHMIIRHVHAVHPSNYWNSSNATSGGQTCALTGKKTVQFLFPSNSCCFFFFKDHHNCSITMYLWFYAWSADLEGESLILNHHVSEPDTPNGLLYRIIWKRCFQKIGIGCTVWPDRIWTPWFWCHNPATTTPAQFLNAVFYFIRDVVQAQS